MGCRGEDLGGGRLQREMRERDIRGCDEKKEIEDRLERGKIGTKFKIQDEPVHLDSRTQALRRTESIRRSQSKMVLRFEVSERFKIELVQRQ